MKPKHKTGDRKLAGKLVVEVMHDPREGDSFSGTPHYAVWWRNERGLIPCGWMPVALFDALPNTTKPF